MANDDSYCQTFTGSLATLVKSHPGKVALVFLLVSLAMLIPLAKLDTSTKLSDYLPQCAYIQADDTLRRKFNTPLSIISILQAEDGNLLDKQGLALLIDLEEVVLSCEQVSAYLIDYDDPIVTVADAVEGVLFDLSNGLYGLADAPEDILQESIEEALEDENVSALVSKGSGSARQYAIILVHLSHNKIARDDETAELALFKTMQDKVPTGYKLTSLAARNYYMERDARDGFQTLLPIALVLLCVVLIVSLRSIADFVICILALVATVVISFGIFALLDLQFSQITFFAPIVIIVLAIDYAIHLLHRYNECSRGGLGPEQAMARSIRLTGVSVFFSALTTILAFGSNGLSNIPAISAFGLFLALGIAVALASMLLLVPSLKLLWLGLGPVLLPSLGKIHQSGSDGSGVRNSQAKPGPTDSRWEKLLCSSLSLGVVVIALGLCVAGLFMGQRIKTDMSSKDVSAYDSPTLQAQRILNARFPSIGMDWGHIVIEADICAPQVLPALARAIDNMADDKYLAKLEGKAKVQSIVAHLQKTTRLGGDASGLADSNGDSLPDSRQAIAESLAKLYHKGQDGVVSAGAVQALLGRGTSPKSFNMTAVLLETHDTNGTNAGKLLADLAEDLKPLSVLPGVKINYAGWVFERYQLITEMTAGMTRATFVSIILCTVVVIFLFRSLRFGLITALPVILITGWIMGSIYLLDFTLNIITATITAMSIGIGIDYSIHLVERFRQERQAGLSPAGSVIKSLRTTGPALLAAAATTVSGFLVLSFGKIGMMQSFGILASLAILYAVFGSVVVLPGMLMSSEKLSQWLRSRASSQDKHPS